MTMNCIINMRYNWVFGTRRFLYLKNIWKIKQSCPKKFELIVLVLETSNIVDSDENLFMVLSTLKKTTHFSFNREEKFSLNIICKLFIGETNVIFHKQLTKNSSDIAWKNFRQILDIRLLKHELPDRYIDDLFQITIDHAQHICSLTTDISKLECCGILIMTLLTEYNELSIEQFDDDTKNSLESINNDQFQGNKLILLIKNRGENNM